jgi:flagellar hook-length control protein FliK
MASTVVASNEIKAASAAADSDEAAMQLVAAAAPEDGGDGSDSTSNASNSGESSEEGESKASTAHGKALANVFEAGKASADKADAKAKAAMAGKQAGGKEVHATPVATDADKVEAERALVTELMPAGVENAAAKLTGEDVSTDEPQAGEASESKTRKNDGVDRLKLPPIEQTAELAAAIDRHIALMEQSGSSGGDANASQSSAAPNADAVASAASPSKTQATLDRLAAASMRRSESATSPDGGPAIDRHRFVQRVEGAMRSAQQRDGRVQVRLAPPELGSLRIELSVQNGVMAAKLEAETSAARNALLDNLPALRERLAEQNIRVEKFDVDIRRDSQGSGGDGAAFDGRERGGDAGSHDRRERSPQLLQPKATARPVRTTATTSESGLDVRI